MSDSASAVDAGEISDGRGRRIVAGDAGRAVGDQFPRRLDATLVFGLAVFGHQLDLVFVADCFDRGVDLFGRQVAGLFSGFAVGGEIAGERYQVADRQVDRAFATTPSGGFVVAATACLETESEGERSDGCRQYKG